MSFIGSYNPHLLDGVQHVHFIGCGGSGTYPLIQILHSRGLTISGSDVEETKITKAERAMGVTAGAAPEQRLQRPQVKRNLPRDKKDDETVED